MTFRRSANWLYMDKGIGLKYFRCLRDWLPILLLGSSIGYAATGTVVASHLDSLPAGSAVNAVTRDIKGNTLLAGQITPPGADSNASDAFVASLSSDGTLQYLTKLGGLSFDTASAIAVDNAGNAYVAGRTGSTDFPTTPNAWQTSFDKTPENSLIGFVVKLGPSGAVIYSTLINHAYGAAIAVNPSGEAFVTGFSNDKLATTPGAPDFGTAKGHFILRLSAGGDRPIFSLLGPGGSAMVLDANNVYTAGSGFDQGDVPTTPGAYQQHATPSTCGGGIQFQIPCSHQYVCKIDQAGAKLAFCTYLSGGSAENVGGLAVDSRGDIYLAGTTFSNDYPTTNDAIQPKNVSTQPPFPVNPPVYPLFYQFFPSTGYLSKLSGDGARLLYSSYLGGSQHDYLTGLVLDDTGLYIAARVDSPDFPGLPPAPVRCLPNRLHDMPVLLRLDAASFAVVSETVVEGAAQGTGTGPLLALDAQHGATLVSGPHVARVGQVSTALFDPIACITDAADFTQAAPVAPGQLLTIFGTGIGPATPAAYDPNAAALPTMLGGASVTVNGVAAPMLYAAANQINFLAPYDTTGQKTMSLKLTGPGGVSAQRALAVTGINPSLLTFGNTDYPVCQSKGLLGSTGAAVYNDDGSLNACEHRAAAGSRVSVVLNGTGLLAPVVTDNYNVVEGVAPVPGQPLGVWQVFLRLNNNAHGYAYTSLRVGNIPVREQQVAIWVAP
jgi:uncharacterized protein (TIGR03437 family)